MVHPEAEMHTPYGATECLPVATIEAREVLGETAARTTQGAGVCVGRKFETIDWRIIRISDGPIASIDDVEELPTGEIGELIVRGPQVSPAYMVALQPLAPPGGRSGDGAASRHRMVRDPRAEPGAAIHNTISKIHDGEHVWHRIGDVGYLDDRGRFWYCGRKSHLIETSAGTLYTECCEAVFNAHPDVRRTALVGVGPRGGQTPAVVYEPLTPKVDHESVSRQLSEIAARFAHTREIRHFLPYSPFPVDVRHNAKINREQLAVVAAQTLQRRPN